MSDYTVIWSGSSKQPLPGLSGEGFVQKQGSYLTRAAHVEGTKTGDVPTRQSMVGKTDLDGLQIRQPSVWRKSGTPTAAAVPAQLKVNCRNCGRRYKTRIAGQMRLCINCRAGRPRKAA